MMVASLLGLLRRTRAQHNVKSLGCFQYMVLGIRSMCALLSLSCLLGS